MPIDLGTRLGQYVIEGILGVGGMGEVYRARDTRLGRSVAIKLVPQELAKQSDIVARFEFEARTVAALSHPNILAIYDFGSDQGVTYAVTELLEGETLRQRVSTGPIPWRVAVEVAASITEGLDAAHSRGIIHRDLKPENIFLTSDGRVKILDFGIATLQPHADLLVEPGDATIRRDSDPFAAPRFLTQAGTLIGTIGYMAPEQARGERSIPQSDIFSFGCVMYEMLSARQPFARETVVAALAAVLTSEPPPLNSLMLDIPSELSRLVSLCLAKRVEERFQSARDVSRVLREMLLSGTANFRLPTMSPSSQPTDPAFPVTPRPASRRKKTLDSIAVLPFENAIGDSNMDYLTDGITETLINTVSQLPKLRVMARSTVFRYKNSAHEAREVGRQLNVAAVLTGRVSLRGKQLTVSTELVDVANGWQLWGEQYNRPMDDIFTVEEDIAQQIYENLRMKVTGDQKKRLAKRHTNDSEAYQLHLKGRYHWNKRTPEGFRKAMEFFQQAIDQDPFYALAHCGLSDCYNVLGSYTLLPPEKAYSRAKAAAKAALNIDRDLGEAHASLAYVKFNYDWDFRVAEREFRKSIHLNSGYAPARQWYSMFLGTRGRFGESIAQGTRALELDPLSLSVNMIQGWMLFEARRFEEAADQLEKTIEIDATFLASHFFLGMTYWMLGRPSEALQQLSEARAISPQNPHVIAGHGFMQGISGDRESARAVLDVLSELSKTAYVPAQEVAVVYIGLGELDEAMGQLELAFEERGAWLLWLNVDPVFDSLRAHPRFAVLLERVENAH